MDITRHTKSLCRIGIATCINKGAVVVWSYGSWISN